MIEVCCAIIIKEDGAVFTAQRRADQLLPLKFEFPGGKIEPGETPEECLVREIREELDLEIEIVRKMEANIHHYPEFSVHLMPFVCRIKSGTLTLTAHAACHWVRPADLKALDWAEADIPLVNNYLQDLK